MFIQIYFFINSYGERAELQTHYSNTFITRSEKSLECPRLVSDQRDGGN